MSKLKLTVAVIALLALVGVVNYAIKMDPTQLAARGVGLGDHHHHGDEEEEAEPPIKVDVMGPEDAALKLEVFYDEDNPCMAEFEPTMKGIAEQYAPHVRVEFKPTSKEENMLRSQEVRLGCEAGIAINGEVVKKAPGEEGLIAFRGPPGQKDFTSQQLRDVVEDELRTRGLQFTRVPDEGPPPVPPGDDHAGHQHDH